jgi:hypothetical protein
MQEAFSRKGAKAQGSSSRASRFAPWRLCVSLSYLAGVGGVVMLAAGCGGSGTVKVVPMMRADFTDQEPLIQNVPFSEAYWDVNGRGQVVVVLRRHAPSVLGRGFDFDWQMSLVLEGLPAGSSRLYQLKSESVRILQTYGLDQRRCGSWAGVAVLHAPRNLRLRGRFHADLRQQQFGLLTGWAPQYYYQAPTLIVVGEFEAVRRPKLASEICELTESAGLPREPVTSQPAGMRSSFGPFGVPPTSAPH